MHRGEYAKRHGLLRFELFRKIDKFLNFRNILISSLEGEKKFLSELCELRNFREGYKKNKNKDRGTESAMTDFCENERSCFGRSALLCRQGKNLSPINSIQKNLLQIAQDDEKFEKIEPLSRISNAHYHSQRTAPSPRWVEGIDSVIINNFSNTVFSRFTSHFSRKRTAFTLAEVLITLGIIGIVAAITLPTIINNYRVKVLENQFKKADSIIQQAVQKTANEYGYTSLAELNVAGCATCDNNENYRLLKQQIPEINDIWYKQFKTVKIFSDSEAYWKNIYCNSFFGAKHNNTTYSCLYSGSPYKYMILADGMTVSPLFAYLGGSTHPVLIEAVFDTNGPYKGPNRIGYDIFRYETMNYNTMCNPNIVNSENFKGCYHWAHRNVSPLDSSKSYWSVLYKPLSYWKK